MSQIDFHLKIMRYNPEVGTDPWWDEFDIQVDPMDRLLDALNEVKWHHDGTLAYRRSCAHGICGSDAVMINGRNGLACKILVADVGKSATIEPIRGLPVLKDLIVDMEPFFEGYKAVLPYLIDDSPAPEGRERIQTPEELERFEDSTKCILCACCTTSCPIFWGDETYIGPAAIVNAHRFIFDSRDDHASDRLDILADASGVFRCKTTFNCTEACPRDIKVTKAVQDVKRAILFDRS